MNIFHQLEGFEWDRANINKNWDKHRVAYFECEEVFFNEPLVVVLDQEHSASEARYFALGRTSQNRLLFVVFTIRGKKLRVISARDMNKKEKGWYK